MKYSKQLTQKAIDLFQPKYKRIGIKLTEEDAAEIIDKCVELLKFLMGWDKKDKLAKEKFPWLNP